MMIKLEVNCVTKLREGILDAFTSGTIGGPRHDRPVFPFKYYISKVGGGEVSDYALILGGGWGVFV
jgi:hypothetical protein